MKRISFGAESSIFLTSTNSLIKVREPQLYKHQELDNRLRRKRTKREVKVLEKLYQSNVNVPRVLNVDIDNFQFEMEYIRGNTLQRVMSKYNVSLVIKEIAKMHSLGIVHLDLTPLNIIVEEESSKIVLIDFGLADFSTDREDRAVDLNVFFSILANEFKYLSDSENCKKDSREYEDFFSILLNEYISFSNNSEEAKEVINRLREVQKRGRNKNKN